MSAHSVPGDSSPAGGPAQPGGGPPLPTGPGALLQPFRALAIVGVATAVAVVALARMNGVSPPSGHAVTTTTTTVTASTTQPLATTSSTTSTSAVQQTTSTRVSPVVVRVLVLNGWSTRHAALYFQKKLAGLGYDTLSPGNAVTADNKVSTLFVVTAADQPNALAVATQLGLPSSAVVSPSPSNDKAIPVVDLHKADLTLVVGADLSRQVPAGYNG